ncbi:3D domain-containing protein [Oceanobacillus senegalensis]|uniref:3D domain-containing protein n=1 Tax=Oceanobacillus senegalensis TaxID=1936063 RepID=UPI000A3128C5|nr:3D domain-containing protein [Oceanobacillus senegalensis]
MKKLFTAIIGMIFFSIFTTTVSAEEYEVKKGDTLWEIAQTYNTSVKVLMDINKLNSSLIIPEQVLKIESDIETYEVQKGDTLSGISDRYGEDVSTKELMAWNELSSDLILVGQQLVVNGHEVKGQLAVKSSDNTEKQASVSIASHNVSGTEKKQKPEQVSNSEDPKVEGKTFSVEATAYTAYCSGCSGITATGMNLKANPNAKVIAVDPNVIPLGTEVYVEGYGQAIAADTGGAIKGNKIDVHVPTKDEAYSWGRKNVEVTILEE